jgi:hypothetical protein
MGAAVASLLSANTAHAACDPARAVALQIEDERDVSLRQSVERHVIAELRSGHIGVCDAAPGAVLATLRIRMPAPERPRAYLRVSPTGAEPLERELDVTGLPSPALARAIASAADELVRAVLVAPAVAEPAGAGQLRPELDAAPAAELDALDVSSTTNAPIPQARFELGLASAASSVFGQREALGADLTTRFWLEARIAIDAAVGAARRLSRPNGRGSVQPSHDVHAALGAAYELWRADGGFGLVGQAGLELARVGFDEGIGGTSNARTDPSSYVAIVANSPAAIHGLDGGWWLLGRAGLEGRYRTGPVGFSLVLRALVPVMPAESDWGNTTSLDRVGAEASAGVWIALGRSE